jgi:hypothetical protein
MSTPKPRTKKDPLETLAVRAEPEFVARVDAIRPQLSKPWREATRSDALRALLVTGLEIYESGAAIGSPPQKKQKNPGPRH